MSASQQPAEEQPAEERIEQEVVLDVPAGQVADTRLDVYITRFLPNVTRSKVQRGIKDGRVSVNGAVVTKPSTVVQAGDRLVAKVLRPPPIELTPEAIPLDIVYEDDVLLVVNKPAGMVVHPAYGHRSGTLVNALLYHVGAGPLAYDDIEEEDDEDVGLATQDAGPRFEGDPVVRPGLVHRLDKDTTGLMVVAKTDAALSHLAKQFAARTTRRLYLALVWGVPDPPVQRIETELGRSPRDRKRMAVVKPGRGKHAITHLETLEAHAHTALCRFRLETGRTHQIRVHARHLGHPLFGDRTYDGNCIVYGSAVGSRAKFMANLFAALPRQALHAHTLGFAHPVTEEPMDFEAPLPDDMAHVLERLRTVEPA
ncbi:MAG: RluA family pseudouridine synthase [Bacteroidota bacterium]